MPAISRCAAALARPQDGARDQRARLRPTVWHARNRGPIDASHFHGSRFVSWLTEFLKPVTWTILFLLFPLSPGVARAGETQTWGGGTGWHAGTREPVPADGVPPDPPLPADRPAGRRGMINWATPAVPFPVPAERSHACCPTREGPRARRPGGCRRARRGP